MPNQRTTVEEFEEIVVRTLSDGSHVYLKDVATIELGAVTYNLTAESNDKPCTVILVNQTPGSNAIELSKMVTAKMDEISEKFPPNMKYDIIIDSTTPVVAGIKEILTTLGFALMLVILVIYIFIQSARATLIPLVAIPVSLIGAFIFFPMLGFSINVLTLLGLVLAIGIVVDDAIVVVEAVQVNIEKGMNPKEATIKAMQVVSSPIIATTVVLIAVFIPVSLMGGITGRLYQQFAITITFSVIISTINALTLSPALCSLVLRPKDKNKKQKNTLLQKFFNWFNRVFGRGVDRYLNATEVLTGKTKRGAIYLVVIAIAGFLTLSYLPKSFLPEEDQGYIMLSVQLPNAASLSRTDAVVAEVADIIQQYDFVEFVTTVSGYNILSSSMSSYTGIVWVKLVDWNERSMTTSEFVDKLNKEMYFAINGATVYAFGPPAILGLGTASGFSMVLLDKGDNTPQYLAEQTDLFIEACKSEPAIGMVNSTYEADIPQKAFIINDKMALKSGVDLNELHSTLSSFMGGSYINKFNRFGRIYDTYLEADAKYRQSEKDLDLFSVQNNKGESFPLSSFVSVRDTIGPEFVNHYNLFRSVTLMGQSAPGYSSIETTDALERVAAKALPLDMDYTWTDMSYQEQSAGSGTTALLLSLTFVFLILAALYESWSLPLTILLGTPFAIFGATFFILIGRYIDPIYSDDVFLQISLVMLVAMAAKNAILVIQYAVGVFEEGEKTLKEAALEAAKLRIRPIMMTAFSFILGIMPLIVASGANSISRRVMGLALLGGMLVATILGIFFYPMLYVLIGKLAGYDKKRNVELETKTEE